MLDIEEKGILFMQKVIFCLLVMSLLFINDGLFFKNVNGQTNDAKITKFQIKNPAEITRYGELWITIDCKEKLISDSTKNAWIVNAGREIVYTGSDGAGGYENEGQSLWIYDARFGGKRKILSAYFMIDAVAEKRLSNGKLLLLVRMSDGGLGASYFSVVDPTRGEIFFRKQVELLDISGDTITLGFYNDWENMDCSDKPDMVIIPERKLKPSKKETHDLTKIINNEVIYNENSFTRYSEKNENLKRVKIYLWRANDIVPNRNFVLSPVYRYVNPKVPLRPTLEALFGEVKKYEADYGFSSSTFGLKFEGVTIKKGTAVIKISQSPNDRNYGTLGAFIFVDAVKKTAMQFPTVKKVEICRIGETFIDAELAKPFSKCK